MGVPGFFIGQVVFCWESLGNQKGASDCGSWVDAAGWSSASTRAGSTSAPFFILEHSLLRRIISQLFVMGGTIAQSPVGRQVFLPGHFELPVTMESAHLFGKDFACLTPFQLKEGVDK